MNILEFDNYDTLSKEAALKVAQLLNQKPDSIICFPSGDTPRGMFEELIKLKNENKLDFSHCTFIGLDEWLGFGRSDKGGCRYMLDKDFFIPAGIDENQIHFFDGLTSDPTGECLKIEELLQKLGPIDIMVLGLGMNGHLGLNEPGTPFNERTHISTLQSVTKQVAVKYDLDNTDLNSGITLGLANIMEAGCVMLLASSAKKSGIVNTLLNEPASVNIPASVLKEHINSYLYADKAALGR